jgi:hypothetical protein
VSRKELQAFRSGLRRRYTDEQILADLAASAERLGRSPTMREFAADPRARVHPQTVVERFGSWNSAKRRAGLVARRFATKEELLLQLRALGDELGRTPTGGDLDEHRARTPSKSLYWHRFGSLSNALRAAGFDVPGRDERLERALGQGERLARRLGRLRAWRTGPGRGGGGRRCSPSGRSTGSSPATGEGGRPSSSSCASGSRARGSRWTRRAGSSARAEV